MISQNLLLGSDGYLIQRSLRFRASASAYLNRTPASASNRTTWTWSGWVKRGSLGIYGQLFSARNSDNNNFGLLFFNDDTLYFADQTVPTYNIQFKTTQVFRDPSASYHIVLSIDTTQATNTNRVKLYVNGLQVSSFSTATYPTQNLNTYVNTTNAHNIGAFTSGSNHFDGYLTEINFIDGQALTPSSFGETDPLTGVWKPKKYAGTYGTNGFYLPFSDNSSTTTLGYDKSGNSNNWTTNNISLTAGSTYDSMTDVPTLDKSASNFAVMNPLRPSSYGAAILTNGNLNVAQNTTAYVATTSTLPVSSGKRYWEVTCGVAGFVTSIGITTNASANGFTTGTATYHYDGSKYLAASNSAYGSSYTNGDVLGFALDMDAGTLVCYKNNVSQGTLVSGLTGDVYAYATLYGSNNVSYNFGQRPFTYTPPTGFLALNTFNLPTPTIGATASTQASKYFNVGTYTGTGSSSPLSVTGADTPDLVWIKGRSGASSHSLLDKLRDSADPFSLRLYSNATNSEYDYGSSLLTPTSTGFNLTTADGDHNTNTGTYVAWSWKANGTGSSNTAGSITSTVSANPTAGFSVVTYTGTGANATVGHGLGVAPKMIIVKWRGSISDWAVYHSSVDATPQNYVLNLNNSSAKTALSTAWNNTAPTSSVFSIGSSANVNYGPGGTYVAYCFSEVAGYSKFGSYDGNSSIDGPFIYCGFRPKFILIKKYAGGSAADWHLHDTARDTYNSSNSILLPDSSGAESVNAAFALDILSNGFKLRTSDASTNGPSFNHIYMAFAENPFKHSLAR